MKCFKDEKEKMLVREKDINDGLKKYFHNLFNEVYEILPYLNMLDNIEYDQTITTLIKFKNLR